MNQRSHEAELQAPIQVGGVETPAQGAADRVPLYQRCSRQGKVVPATVVHHVEPHRGDMQKFFGGPFESLCAQCHNSAAQSEERLGYSIGADGWPVDPRHPANASLDAGGRVRSSSDRSKDRRRHRGRAKS